MDLIMFDTFKRDFNKAYPNTVFKIEDVKNMDSVIKELYNKSDYEIDSEFHILELY